MWRQRARSGAICRQRENGRRNCGKEDVWRFDCPYRRGGSRLSGSLLWHPGRKNRHTYFVPPVYDVQEPDGFFRIEEEQISGINRRIEELQADVRYKDCKQRLTDETILAGHVLDDIRERMKAAKVERDRLRSTVTRVDSEQLIRESQFQKAELKRQKQYWKDHLASLQAEVEVFETEIERLKAERKTRSAALQQWLFKQFRMLTPAERNGICATCLKIPSKRHHRQVQVSVRLPSFCNMPTGTVGNLLLWLNSGGEILRKTRSAVMDIIIRPAKGNADRS